MQDLSLLAASFSNLNLIKAGKIRLVILTEVSPRAERLCNCHELLLLTKLKRLCVINCNFLMQ